MPTTFALTTLPVPLFPGGFQGALLLYNTGPGTVYVSGDPSVSAVNGWPIAKGSTLSWAAGKALFAVSDSTATLLTDDSAGSMTSAADVATALIDSGLPQDIASKLYATGVPPVDSPQLLGSYTGTATGLAAYFDSWQADVSPYQSVRLYIQLNTDTITTGNTIHDMVFAFGDAVSSPASGRVTCVQGHNETAIAGDVPVWGQFLTASYGFIGAANTFDQVQFFAYGSYRATDTPRWQVSNAFWNANVSNYGEPNPACSFVTTYPVAANTAVMLYPSWVTGDLYYTFNIDGANTSGTYIGFLMGTATGHYLGGGGLITGQPLPPVSYGPLTMTGKQPVVEINSHNSVSTNYDLAIAFL